MDKGLNILGIARKAGRLEIGEEPVCAAARGKYARLILVASDAADNTRRRAENCSGYCTAPVIEVDFTKEELGRITGRGSCALAAVCDLGLAHLFVGEIAAGDPERYGELAEELRRRAERAERRAREKRIRGKSRQTGKKRGG